MQLEAQRARSVELSGALEKQKELNTHLLQRLQTSSTSNTQESETPSTRKQAEASQLHLLTDSRDLTVHYTVHSSHCTLYSALISLYTIQCTPLTVHYKCTPLTVHYTVHSSHCTLYSTLIRACCAKGKHTLMVSIC